jgi:prepilin-type N-terminal cleavage/methylation domain-containing protein
VHRYRIVNTMPLSVSECSQRPCHFPRRTGRQAIARGFTLVELTTTLAITGALTAITLPALGTLYMNVRVKTVAAEFAADLRYARAEAVSRQTAVQVLAPSERGWEDGWLVRDRKQVLVDRSGPLHVQVLDPAQGQLTFNTRGVLTRAGSYSVLFHAPEYRWTQPRCVYVRPDGRPIVETAPVATSACGRR